MCWRMAATLSLMFKSRNAGPNNIEEAAKAPMAPNKNPFSWMNIRPIIPPATTKTKNETIRIILNIAIMVFLMVKFVRTKSVVV